MNVIARVCVCLGAMWFALAPASLAQISIGKPALVKNINTASDEDQPVIPVTELNGMLIFKAFTPGSGWELWKSDGSERGAVRIKDINAGPRSAFEPTGESFVSLGGWLLFAADDGISGVELWKTDGTEGGTVQLADIQAGAAGSRPKDFLLVNDVIYFTGEREHGIDLWKSDGTASGTRLFKRLPNNRFISALAQVNGTILFTLDSGEQSGLWKSDGTEAGTTLVHSIPGAELDPMGPICANGTLFFFTYSSWDRSAASLWKSDGTADGTVRIKDVYLANYNGLGEVFTANGMLFFNANAGLWTSDGTESGTIMFGGGGGPRQVIEKVEIEGALFLSLHTPGGTELWRSDGTAAGTVMLHSFPHNPNNAAAPHSLVSANGMLWFTAYDETSGFEVWKSDGTPHGTVRVKDIRSGADSSFPGGYINLNDRVLFTARDSNAGLNLWETDGTETGTAPVKQIQSRTNDFYPYSYASTITSDRAVFMVAVSTNKVELWSTDGTDGGTHTIHEFDVLYDEVPHVLSRALDLVFLNVPRPGRGLELWRTDGTSAGTFLVRDAYFRDYGSLPSTPVEANGMVFFSVNFSELWRSDGTESGTILLKRGSPDQEWREPSNLVDVNGTLFFTWSIRSEENGQNELWKSDGTETGTVRVKALDSFVQKAINVNGLLLFWTDAYELWKSDGTESGTDLIKEFSPNFLGSFVSVGNELFFSISSPDTGWGDLWKSDGTEVGTTLVKDIVPGPGGVGLRSLVNVNQTLFFIAGHELWKSDGTESGTVRLKEFTYSNTDNLVALNGMLFFTAEEPVTGHELWRSDGTQSGTVLFKDINPGPVSSDPFGLTRVGETLFFWIHIGDHYSLWKTDGTETGTMLITENIPLPTSEVGGHPISANGLLYFFGTSDADRTMRIWRSDGTATGTFALPDPAGAPLSFYSHFFYPSVMVEANGTIFFRANDGVTGFELWKVGDRDSDNDGLPDWWESGFFSQDAKPEDDPDADGMNNREESRAGTNPTSPISVLKLTRIRSLAGGKIQIEWPAVANQEYVLLRSSTVSENPQNYTVVERRIRATSPVNSYIDVTAQASGSYFYRLKVEE